MTTRLSHKRGNTLRWHCTRVTDPKPGSGEDPVPISLTGVTVTAALRNDVLGFYHPLSISYATVNRAQGEFLVYAPSNVQEDWPLGDVYFDFLFSNPSSFSGQPDDKDQTETAIMHIQKEETLWP